MPTNTEVINWEIEEIPDLHCLFLRIHVNNIRGDIPLPIAFKEGGSSQSEMGMSTDWCKYSSPIQCKNRHKSPNKVGVLSLKVDKIREIPNLQVLHSPIMNHPTIENNRAHSDVKGVSQLAKSRAELMQIYEWKIKP